MDYSTYTTTPEVDKATENLLAGMSGGALAIFIIVLLAVLVLMAIAMWKIYTKAGQPGWAIFVPIYNNVVMFDVIGMQKWNILIMLYVPFAAIVYAIMIPFKLAKAFGKGVGFGFLLWLIPIIGYPVLAFGSAEHQA